MIFRSPRTAAARYQGAVKRVRAFGPTQRADIVLACGTGADTLIEIDAPRAGVLKAGDIVGLQPRRYRIFAGEG